MLEELLDREVGWCCLQTVGNVLFWDTHSSFPKFFPKHLAKTSLEQMLHHSSGLSRG